MKLNNRRTILVGLAFLSICTFWQMYDSVMTLILTDTFKLNETFAGAIMAADNVLALFLLPFFGALSDKTHTKFGRRMPFIVGGTAAAAGADEPDSPVGRPLCRQPQPGHAGDLYRGAGPAAGGDGHLSFPRCGADARCHPQSRCAAAPMPSSI